MTEGKHTPTDDQLDDWEQIAKEDPRRAVQIIEGYWRALQRSKDEILDLQRELAGAKRMLSFDREEVARRVNGPELNKLINTAVDVRISHVLDEMREEQ